MPFPRPPPPSLLPTCGVSVSHMYVRYTCVRKKGNV